MGKFWRGNICRVWFYRTFEDIAEMNISENDFMKQRLVHTLYIICFLIVGAAGRCGFGEINGLHLVKSFLDSNLCNCLLNTICSSTFI